MTRIIGLTGGIGTGKSTVARLLEELGAVIIDSDSLAHEALQPGSKIWHDVVTAFGREIVSPSGEINHAALAKTVFGHPEQLARLNAIMHPRLKDIARTLIEEHRRQGAAVIVLEAPLLIEAGWEPMVDDVWVVTAPEPVVMERLRTERRLSDEDILARIRSQLSGEERLKHADVVISNNCGLDELRDKIAALWARLTSSAK